MRYKLAILFFFISLISIGQSGKDKFKALVLGQYNVQIDSSNEQIIYNIITELVELDNQDSAFKASKLMWALCLYDNSKYPVAFFKPLLTRIIKSKQDYYTNAIEGEWRFSHNFFSGLGLMNSNSKPSDTLNTLNLNNGIAKFSFNNMPVRYTKYDLITEINGFALAFNTSFKIHFLDTGEEWVYTISKNYNKNGQLELTRILEPGCVCGCGYKIYLKQSDNLYITKK